MEIMEVSAQEYRKLDVCYFSAFEKPEFLELNKDKADRLTYLLFRDGKNRFATCGGVTGDRLCFPFSASFAMLNNISLHNKIVCYHDAVATLDAWAREKGLRQILFSLPPMAYDLTGISQFLNALFVNDYVTQAVEVNYEYYLSDYTDDYPLTIDPKARQKLRAALKNDLSFEKTRDVTAVYEIIRQNRESKGFPLHMSLEQVQATVQVIDADMFLVRQNQIPVASALIYKLNAKVLRVIYWGNVPGSDMLHPMNYLAYRVFQYYRGQDYELLDIGHSTDNSIPNFGLCDFKQSIGCRCSNKYVMCKTI